jgi:hypothetical protein
VTGDFNLQECQARFTAHDHAFTILVCASCIARFSLTTTRGDATRERSSLSTSEAPRVSAEPRSCAGPRAPRERLSRHRFKFRRTTHFLSSSSKLAAASAGLCAVMVRPSEKGAPCAKRTMRESLFQPG